MHRLTCRLWVVHLVHVSGLSAWELPYPPGYGFPVPFGWWPSLLGPSSSHWRIPSPLRLTYCGIAADSIGVVTFRTEKIRLGRVGSLLRGHGVLVGHCVAWPTLPALCRVHGAAPRRSSWSTTVPSAGGNEASTSLHGCSPFPSFPCLAWRGGSAAPWAFSPASHPAVTSDARGQWEQVLDTDLVASISLLHSSCATSCRTTESALSDLRHVKPCHDFVYASVHICRPCSVRESSSIPRNRLSCIEAAYGRFPACLLLAVLDSTEGRHTLTLVQRILWHGLASQGTYGLDVRKRDARSSPRLVERLS